MLVLGLCLEGAGLAPLPAPSCVLLRKRELVTPILKGLHPIPGRVPDKQRLCGTLSIYKYCIYGSHTDSRRGRLVSLWAATGYHARDSSAVGTDGQRD